MGEATGIEWTDHTLNPWIGCAKVSPACKDCYAARSTFARRSRANGVELWGADAARHVTADSTWDAARMWNRKAGKEGVRRRVFCASLADVFEDRADLVEPRRRLWALIDECRGLDWLLLTKRPQNIRGMLPASWGTGWSHVWLGTTVEDQERANERILHLIEVPAAVHFLSMEPLLEPIDLTRVALLGPGRATTDVLRRGTWDLGGGFTSHSDMPGGIDWVIVGGESGGKPRSTDLAWVLDIVEQCKAAGVRVFVKQAGDEPSVSNANLFDFPPGVELVEHGEGAASALVQLKAQKGGDPAEWPEPLRVREFPRARGAA